MFVWSTMVSRTRRTLDFSFIVDCMELPTEYFSCQFVYLFIGHSSFTLAVAYVVYIITMKSVFNVLCFLFRVFASCACVGRLGIRPDTVVISNGFFGVSGVWMFAFYFFCVFRLYLEFVNSVQRSVEFTLSVAFLKVVSVL